MGLVVAARSDELSNREFREKRIATRLFSNQAMSSRIRHARRVFSVAIVNRPPTKRRTVPRSQSPILRKMTHLHIMMRQFVP